MNKFILKKGTISIILAILLLSVSLIIGLGVSVLMFQQIKMSGQAGRSVIAFYAAEAGAEKCLYDVRQAGAVNCANGVLVNGSNYTTDYNGIDTITSFGGYKGINRKIELNWE